MNRPFLAVKATECSHCGTPIPQMEEFRPTGYGELMAEFLRDKKISVRFALLTLGNICQAMGEALHPDKKFSNPLHEVWSSCSEAARIVPDDYAIA